MFCDCAIPRTAGKAPVWDTTLAVGRANALHGGGPNLRPQLHRLPRAGGPGERPGGGRPDPVPRNLTTARFSDRRLSHPSGTASGGRPCPPGMTSPRATRGLLASLGTLAPEEPPPELTGAERAMAQELFASSAPSATARTGRATGLRPRSWPRPRRTSTRSGPRRPTRRRRWSTGSGARRCLAGAKAHAGRAEAPGSLRPFLLQQGVAPWSST